MTRSKGGELRGDKIVKIDKTLERNCYAELGFLQSLGQEQFLFVFTNEIPLCSTWQTGLKLQYFDSLLIGHLASMPAPSRPLSLAARNIFLKCKYDLATSSLRFTFFSDTHCRLDEVPAGPRQPLQHPAFVPPSEEFWPSLPGIRSTLPRTSAESPCPDALSPIWYILRFLGGSLLYNTSFSTW